MLDKSLILPTKATLFLYLYQGEEEKLTLLKEYFSWEKGQWVFIFPLKILAWNFYDFLKNSPVHSILAKGKLEFAELQKLSVRQNFLLILYPESCGNTLNHFLEFANPTPSIVLMDLQYFYNWETRSFSDLWELFMGLCNTSVPLIGMWNGQKKEFSPIFCRGLNLGVQNPIIIDFGANKNISEQRIQKYSAYKKNLHFFLPNLGRKIWKRRLDYELELGRKRFPRQTFVVYCRNGKEVDYWIKYYRKLKRDILGCQGGQLNEFYHNLQNGPPPLCIFATPILCSFFDLPEVEKIFFSFKIREENLWYQLISKFFREKGTLATSIYTFNYFTLTKSEILKKIFSAFLLDFFLRLRIIFGFFDDGDDE